MVDVIKELENQTIKSVIILTGSMAGSKDSSHNILITTDSGVFSIYWDIDNPVTFKKEEVEEL